MNTDVLPPPGASYLLRREAQERAAAAASKDRSARCVHLDLADRYARLARTKPVAA